MSPNHLLSHIKECGLGLKSLHFCRRPQPSQLGLLQIRHLFGDLVTQSITPDQTFLNLGPQKNHLGLKVRTLGLDPFSHLELFLLLSQCTLEDAAFIDDFDQLVIFFHQLVLECLKVATPAKSLADLAIFTAILVVLQFQLLENGRTPLLTASFLDL